MTVQIGFEASSIGEAPLPTMEDVVPGSYRLKGFYVSQDTGEAVFVAPPRFLTQDALWRVDVIQDLIRDLEITRRAALPDWAKELFARSPHASIQTRVDAFVAVCEHAGVELPTDFEALLHQCSFSDH